MVCTVLGIVIDVAWQRKKAYSPIVVTWYPPKEEGIATCPALPVYLTRVALPELTVYW